VWDNCGAVNSDRLEKIQTEAARIVTGLTSYASLHSIIFLFLKYLNWSLFLNVKKVGTSRIFKSRVLQVLIVDGKNEFWYVDTL
jgi:hypothetical protein